MSIKNAQKLLLLISITTVTFVISFFCLSNNIYIIHQNLLLIPIVVACFWYKKRGIAYSGIIAAGYIFMYSLYQKVNLAGEFSRVAVFIVIAIVIDILVEKLDDKNKEVLRLNRKIESYLEMMKKSEELSNMGAWRLDLKTNKTVWSDGLYRIFGLSPDSTKASLEKRLEVTYPEDLDMVKGTIINSINKRINVRIESRIIQPDGNIRWISSTGYTEYDESGNPETYIGSYIDITERKLYEQELYKEREKFRITLGSIGDGVIATDVKGNITLLNQQAEKLTGWEYKDAAGKPFDNVFNIVCENSRVKRESPIERVIKSGSIVGLANHTILISRYGTEYSIADSAAPIKDNSGNILGVVIVFRDVTEEKRRRDQINYISYHDSLTGLYNRRFFEEQIKKIDKKENLPISIIMGDVNGLKVTNDAFGHAEGDCLLQKAAQAIKSACRSDDIVARCGGDEYVVLLPKTNKEVVKKIIDRIVKIESEMKVGQVNVSVSLGYCVKEKESDDILTALKNAEDHMYKNKVVESEKMRDRLIENILSTLCEKHSNDIGHFKRVGNISQEIGEAMHLSKEDISKLKAVGRLHDIGKVAIGNEILTKKGPLTQQEWDKIKRHPDIGYKILKSSISTAGLSEYVLYHHERYDGKGYPSGLKGEEIPLLSRIVSVADSFDAMTNDRSYHKAMNTKDAVNELIKNKGTQFDPAIVDAALKLFDNK